MNGCLNWRAGRMKRARAWQRMKRQAAQLFHHNCDCGELTELHATRLHVFHGAGRGQGRYAGVSIDAQVLRRRRHAGLRQSRLHVLPGVGTAKDEARRLRWPVMPATAANREAARSLPGSTSWIARASTPPRAIATRSSQYRKACDGGDMKGCIGSRLHDSQRPGRSQGSGRRRALFRKACDGGETIGCMTYRRYDCTRGEAAWRRTRHRP